jgi:hypothetical protein
MRETTSGSCVVCRSGRILRLMGADDPCRLFLDLEQMRKQWFYAQDTRQISKRKRFLQYVLETGECVDGDGDGDDDVN